MALGAIMHFKGAFLYQNTVLSSPFQAFLGISLVAQSPTEI
jgi:hypothetical protein